MTNKYFSSWIDSIKDINKDQADKIAMLKTQLKMQEKELKIKYINI